MSKENKEIHKGKPHKMRPIEIANINMNQYSSEWIENNILSIVRMFCIIEPCEFTIDTDIEWEYI